MKRHEVLRDLSRDHHPALGFARALRADTPARLAASRPVQASDAVRWALAVWDRDLAPHFLLEERELVPLGLSAGGELRAHTERVVADHQEIRGLIAKIAVQMPAATGSSGAPVAPVAPVAPDDALAVVFDALGALLEAHVRFEERTWFAELQRALTAEQLAELSFRLQVVPDVAVTGWHLDAASDWVADLNCGHTRHVRHRPPLQQAPWVTTVQGRAGHVGVRYPCPKCRMPRLPSCARVYKRLPEFDEVTVPRGLLKSHTLGAGVWGRIAIVSGHLTYVLEDEGDVNIVLSAGDRGIVAPQRPHHIALQPGTRARVEFLRIE